MADQPFNIAKGRAVELYNRVKSNDPSTATLVIMLLKVSESDATLIDYDTFAALLGGSNTEADFTNYARIVLTDSDLAAFPSPDDTNDRYDIDIADQTWASAGGASNNTMTKLIIGYDPTSSGVTDSVIVPLAHYDFTPTTDGSDLIAQINASGFYRAA